MAPNVQLRYNSTIILVIHYQTHSDPYTKKDNFSTCLLNQFISKQEVVTDITLIEILQVLRTCYCNYSFTKPKNFHSLKIPNLMFRSSVSPSSLALTKGNNARNVSFETLYDGLFTLSSLISNDFVERYCDSSPVDIDNKERGQKLFL